MIRKPNGWENVQGFVDRPKLPAGGYVCKIKDAYIQHNDNTNSDTLNVVFDISEGEWSGYYQGMFNSNPTPDAKWKGIYRVWLPRNDGSEKDEYSKRNLKAFITSVENSNRGFSFNWDERTLAGKDVGIIFRNEEWEYNGKSGWTARPFRPCSVDTIEDGSYTVPDDKPLKKSTASVDNWGSQGFSGNYVDMTPPPEQKWFEAIDGELPF